MHLSLAWVILKNNNSTREEVIPVLLRLRMETALKSVIAGRWGEGSVVDADHMSRLGEGQLARASCVSGKVG